MATIYLVWIDKNNRVFVNSNKDFDWIYSIIIKVEREREDQSPLKPRIILLIDGLLSFGVY